MFPKNAPQTSFSFSILCPLRKRKNRKARQEKSMGANHIS